MYIRRNLKHSGLKTTPLTTILITGFSDIPELRMEKLEDPLILPPANSGNNYIATIGCRTEGNKYVFVNVRDEEIAVPVIPWDAPEEPRYLEVRHSFDSVAVKQNYNARYSGDSIIFSGEIRIDENLVIPQNKSVVFEKGTHVNLLNHAAFISYSPVYVYGSETEPVIFNSSDHSGRGINIFQAKGRSFVQHAVFSGLTNMDFDGWFTTAAVCFYESDVDFDHVRFEKNINCDDALNVVRSDFHMQSCTFEDTFADALDTDFCTGEIRNSTFIRAGNDALDCSGSTVSISGSTITEAGDKGVSGGENSTYIMLRIV